MLEGNIHGEEAQALYPHPGEVPAQARLSGPVKNDIAVTKSLLLDYIGYSVASVEEKPARILRGLATEMGGPAEATIIALRNGSARYGRRSSTAPWAT